MQQYVNCNDTTCIAHQTLNVLLRRDDSISELNPDFDSTAMDLDLDLDSADAGFVTSLGVTYTVSIL